MTGMTGKTMRPRGDAWPLDKRPGFLIRRLHQIHAALSRCGTADQTTLAAEVMLDRTTTTGALKRLQSRKFIERTVHSRDRRAQMCRLTKSGERLLQQIEASARAAHHETLDGLSKAEQKHFITLMQKVVAARAKETETVASPG